MIGAFRNEEDNWVNKKWRPVMAWVYMAVNIADFVVFPILWSILQAVQGGQVTNQWDPLTLQGAGLFHIAMGAILGVSAWSRGQEKIANASNFSMPPEDKKQEPSLGMGEPNLRTKPKQSEFPPF